MSDITQPKLAVEEKSPRFAKLKKIINHPHTETALVFGACMGLFATGAVYGGYVMNHAWKSELTRLYNEYEAAGA